MNLLDLARPAVRPAMPARIVVAGPAGLSALSCALHIASGLGRPLVVDAGNQESLELADAHDFDVVHHVAPFHPGRLIKLLEAFDGVVVVNNLSAWWMEEGGLSDIGHASKDGWQTANALMGRLGRAIRFCRGHVVATSRTWSTVHVDVTPEGEIPRLLSGTWTLREDLIRAFTRHLRVDASDVVWDLGSNGVTSVEEVLAEHATWSEAGAPMLDDAEAEALDAAVESIPEDDRATVRRDLAGSFGRSSTIPADHLAEAVAFIARHTKEQP